MTELTLHNYELDDQCYKVRLLLAALGCRYVKVDVDVHPGHEERSARYLKLNPLGALPIITEGAFVLYGAEAILIYLAGKFDAARTWLPRRPSGARAGHAMARLCRRRPASRLRLPGPMLCWKPKPTKQHVCHASRSAFRIMDDHMTQA